MSTKDYCVRFEALTLADVAKVGGKNSSLGEMVSNLAAAGIPVPPGYATTADAYWALLDHSGLRPVIASAIAELHSGARPLADVGRELRRKIREAPLPPAVAAAIVTAYRELGAREGRPDPSVAVRSSATAEDLPEASFAGQQDTFLNVEGEAALLDACRACYASLFTDRAITYRDLQGFDHLKVALSIGVQVMARSDRGAAGVLFTLDTETGFPDVVMINAAWGLGENVVKGQVNPDEYLVFKPLLASHRPILRKRCGAKEQTMIFARGARHSTRNIETPRSRRACRLRPRGRGDPDAGAVGRRRSRRTTPKRQVNLSRWTWSGPSDGETGALFIVQARPETVQSRRAAERGDSSQLHPRGAGPGAHRQAGIAASATAMVAGPVCVIERAEDLDELRRWRGARRRDHRPRLGAGDEAQAAGIVTDHGGRTCARGDRQSRAGPPGRGGRGRGDPPASTSGAGGHRSRARRATKRLRLRGHGLRYHAAKRLDVTGEPDRRCPPRSCSTSPTRAPPSAGGSLPADGVGLARMEFVISNAIRVHPMALVKFDSLKDEAAKAEIAALTAGYADKSSISSISSRRGLARIAAAVYPKPVIVRMSDFKTNEYAGLRRRRRASSPAKRTR
jgi:pyruvate,water dikinase